MGKKSGSIDKFFSKEQLRIMKPKPKGLKKKILRANLEEAGDEAYQKELKEWDGFFSLATQTDEAKDFLLERKDAPAQKRKKFKKAK